jgi:Zn-dependent protease
MEQKEFFQIAVSWLTISVAFAILISGGFFDLFYFAEALAISLVAVGTGFIFHELSHRNVAKHFGAHAEYRFWTTGLIFAVVSAFLGFLFAAPGAVYIYGGNIDRSRNGKIAAAGPVANIIMGFLFFSLLIFLRPAGILLKILFYTSYINFFLAFFNLLPIFILDGKKVFIWDQRIWAALFITAAFGSFFIF